MNFKYLFLIIIIGLSVFALGCTGSNNTSGDVVVETSTGKTINIDKLEIYHFHATQQCYSCVTVGDYAEETVNTYFKDERDKDIIVFDHINAQLPQNEELVMKYGVTGASLWLGVYKDGNFSAEQNINVWYKINDKAAYMTYLKGVIEQKLAGN